MAVKAIGRSDRYTYRVTWSEEDQEYIGLCAEFPSLSWLAGDQKEALQGINKVVLDVISDMESAGEIPPEPLSTKRYSGIFTVRVPSDIHRMLAIQAAESKVSFNRYISAKLSNSGK